jgi:AraC-like DNA-binding protein
MNIHFNFVSFVDCLALIQGILLGTILIANSRRKYPSLFLGLFLISYTIELSVSILSDTGILEQKTSLFFLPLNFYFLTLPLFYLYVKSLIMPVSVKNIIKPLIPGSIEFMILTILFFLPRSVNLNILENEYFGTIWTIYIISSFVYSIYYALRVIDMVKKHQNKVMDYFSNTENILLKWAKTVAIFIIVFYGLWGLFVLLPESTITKTSYTVLSIINVIFIYWVGISGLRQPEVNFLHTSKKSTSPLTHKKSKSNSSEGFLYDELIQLMIKNKPFKEPDLTLYSLAEQLDVSRERLSQQINKNAKVNFNQFINQYRIEEAKLLLGNKAYNNLNMLGIAAEVGFNSKGTFFSSFKKIAGTSPNEYKKKHNT